jgi:hypothetical protein
MRGPMALIIAKAYYCYVERAVTKQMQCISARTEGGDRGGVDRVRD